MRAAKTPETATIEPKERSIPPVIITKVTPKANKEFIETWVKMIVQLATVRNWEENIDITAQIRKKAMKIPNSLK
jgi:hypothetical protein